MVQLPRPEVNRASPRSAFSRRSIALSSLFIGLVFGVIAGSLPWAIGRGGPNSTIALFMQPVGAKQTAHPANLVSYVPSPVSIRYTRLAARSLAPTMAGRLRDFNVERSVDKLLAAGFDENTSIKMAMQKKGLHKIDLEYAIDVIQELGFDRERVMVMASRYPFLLRADVQLVPRKFRSLEDIGFDSKIVRKMAGVYPGVFFIDMKKRIANIMAVGFDRKTTMKLISAFPGDSRSVIEKRIALIGEEFGLDRKAVMKIATSFPAFLGYDINGNIKPKLDLLQAEGIEISGPASIPRIFSYSLDGTIKPRLMVLKQCSMMPTTDRKLSYWLKLTDAEFSKRTDPFRGKRITGKQKLKLDALQAEGIEIARVDSNPTILRFSLEGRIKPRLMALKQRSMLPLTEGVVLKYFKLTDSEFSKRVGVAHG